METWLPLTDYSLKYKISVSTLRRRIKADDIKYHFQDGKYFIFDEPVKNTFKSSPSPNSLEVAGLGAAGIGTDLIFDDEILNDLDAASEPIETERVYSNRQQPAVSPISQQAYNPDFLENLKKSANSKLPQVKMQQGMISQQQQQQQTVRPQAAINIDEEYFFRKDKAVATTHVEKQEASNSDLENSTLRGFSDKISKIGTNEPVLTAANKLLNELKKAYTHILQEKEEQMMILKEEVSDLKTLVKVLESENDRLKKNR
jgi:hypothetical protein